MLLLSYRKYFWGTLTTTSPVPCSSIICQTQMADNLKSRQLTPKRSRWRNSTAGMRRNMYVWYSEVNYPLKTFTNLLPATLVWCVARFCFAKIWSNRPFPTTMLLIMPAVGLPLNPWLVMHTCKRNNWKKEAPSLIYHISQAQLGKGMGERRGGWAKLQGRHVLTSRGFEKE